MHTRPMTCQPKRYHLRILSFLCAVALGAQADARSAPVQKPKRQAMLPACTTPVAWQGALPQATDESVRYAVAVDGLSVGTVDFQIARTGTFSGAPAVEYRSLFKLDHLLATMADIQGRAASLVPLDAASPKSAMSHYSVGETTWHEELAFADAGRSMQARRQVTPAGAATRRPDATPDVLQPIVDFVTGFYLVRRLPAQTPACMSLYANQHHYVVWLTPAGTERINTPVGMRPADVFAVQYQRVSGETIGAGRIWLSQTQERLPYRIAIGDDRRIEARLHTFAMGRSSGEVKPPYNGASD